MNYRPFSKQNISTDYGGWTIKKQPQPLLVTTVSPQPTPVRTATSPVDYSQLPENDWRRKSYEEGQRLMRDAQAAPTPQATMQRSQGLSAYEAALKELDAARGKAYQANPLPTELPSYRGMESAPQLPEPQALSGIPRFLANAAPALATINSPIPKMLGAIGANYEARNERANKDLADRYGLSIRRAESVNRQIEAENEMRRKSFEDNLKMIEARRQEAMFPALSAVERLGSAQKYRLNEATISDKLYHPPERISTPRDNELQRLGQLDAVSKYVLDNPENFTKEQIDAASAHLASRMGTVAPKKELTFTKPED